jgi:hypothetical protein
MRWTTKPKGSRVTDMTHDTDDPLLPIGAAATILGVSTKTLQRWDKAGLLVPVRDANGARRYNRADLDAYKETTA